MKLKFDARQKYQLDAVDSIVNIFEGLPANQNDFSTDLRAETELIFELGVGNRLTLPGEQMLENVKKIQRENNLSGSPQLISENYDFPNFTVEMETGTGKTYVYLRTIFELNKKYGYKKFIIVVPSVAIREGVLKNLEITNDHFKEIYDNTSFDYFVYNSKKSGNVRKYATSNTIQIMVMNIQAFTRDVGTVDDERNATLFHREADRLSGRAPKEYIASVKPIVILDEPQSIDNTSNGKRAIKSLNPLFALRYSATHRETYNLMYRLDPVQAYELGLVKQIVVASVLDQPNFNGAYVKLLDIDNRKGLRARVEYHEDTGTARYSVKSGWMKNGDDLFGKSGEREEYRNGFLISEITMSETGDGYVRFNDGKVLKKGESIGGMTDEIRRFQIRESIREHLAKEKQMKELGIKVLTLFFIDRVAKYRIYDGEGNEQKGEYAIWFEEEFMNLTGQDEYKGIISDKLEKIHDGYFSQDRQKRIIDSTGTGEQDSTTYDRIMKEKEKLLSFEDPLRFIFSHSALREGWDNPNVFQICTLNDTNTEIKKRQEIGRGLRIPVNQNGERIFNSNLNRLTLIANEHYDLFAKKLQEEYIEEGVEFGILKAEKLKRIFMGSSDDDQLEKAKTLLSELQARGYVSQDGRVTEVFGKSVEDNTFSLGEVYSDSVKFKAIDILERHELRNLIKEKKKPTKIKVNTKVLQDEEFKSFWEKINKKTSYSVGIDSNILVKRTSQAINSRLQVRKVQVQIIKAEIPVDSQGVVGNEFVNKIEEIDKIYEIPDIISYIQRETELTRKTICDILLASEKVENVRINPQQFLDQVVMIIKEELTKLLVDGIKYEKLDGQEYEMRLFEDQEIAEEIRNIMTSDKSPYEMIVTDSKTEKTYAEKLNIDLTVKFYVKLPGWFKIETPIGTYNPDWAILKEDDGLKLYLVRETKGSTDEGDLKGSEKTKISCAEKHFEALGVDFKPVDPPFASIT